MVRLDLHKFIYKGGKHEEASRTGTGQQFPLLRQEEEEAMTSIKLTSRFQHGHDSECLPEQFYDSNRRWRKCPEARLMRAVLKDAIKGYQQYALASDPIGRRLFREIHDWIFEEDDNMWPFSFEKICESLSINSDNVRARLKRWLEQARNQQSKLGQEKKNSRRLKDRVRQWILTTKRQSVSDDDLVVGLRLTECSARAVLWRLEHEGFLEAPRGSSRARRVRPQ